MVTLGNEPDSNIDEETETYVGDEGNEPKSPDIAPTNHVHISRQEAPVYGQFNLDLSLPPQPGIASDLNPKNLTLHTTCGHVNGEIWVKHDRSTKSKRVSLDMSSGGGGSVRALVHGPFSSDNRRSRIFPFLNMEMHSNYGDVYLSLPRCFRGPITIRTGDDRIAFSPAFGAQTALVSDISGVRVYFVGTRPRGGKWGTANSGGNGESVEYLLDEIKIDGKFTSTRINWDGEEDVAFLAPNPWLAFCSGADRFFTTWRVG